LLPYHKKKKNVTEESELEAWGRTIVSGEKRILCAPLLKKKVLLGHRLKRGRRVRRELEIPTRKREIFEKKGTPILPNALRSEERGKDEPTLETRKRRGGRPMTSRKKEAESGGGEQRSL